MLLLNKERRFYMPPSEVIEEIIVHGPSLDAIVIAQHEIPYICEFYLRPRSEGCSNRVAVYTIMSVTRCDNGSLIFIGNVTIGEPPGKNVGFSAIANYDPKLKDGILVYDCSNRRTAYLRISPDGKHHVEFKLEDKK